MDELKAARILTEQKVDRLFDMRPASEILIDMVDKGYLPGSLLERQAEVVQVPPEDNTQIAV